MDVLVTREAFFDLKALNVLRPAAPAWGFLIGHRRGHRLFVERLFPAGSGTVLPPPTRLDELDRLLGRKMIGFYAYRPAAALKRAVLGPYFYGRLFLDVRPSKNGPGLRPFVVEFNRVFFLAPVRLESGPTGGSHG